MSSLPKISIRLDGAMRAADCVALAQAAEKAGFASVWFAENAFARGIMSAATACAVATDRIVINAGVFNPYTRHPAMIAMEIAALADLADGRVGLGLGAGIAAATRRLGLDASKPLPALRDAHSIVRGLLDGQVLSHEGTWFSATEVALEFPPKTHVPIYLAGRGNLTVKFAATASDGLIVSNMCSLVFAGQLAETMAGARSAAGLSADTAVVQYMPCAVDADGDAGRRRARGGWRDGSTLLGTWREVSRGKRGPSGWDSHRGRSLRHCCRSHQARRSGSRCSGRSLLPRLLPVRHAGGVCGHGGRLSDSGRDGACPHLLRSGRRRRDRSARGSRRARPARLTAAPYKKRVSGSDRPELNDRRLLKALNRGTFLIDRMTPPDRNWL